MTNVAERKEEKIYTIVMNEIEIPIVVEPHIGDQIALLVLGTIGVKVGDSAIITPTTAMFDCHKDMFEHELPRLDSDLEDEDLEDKS